MKQFIFDPGLSLFEGKVAKKILQCGRWKLRFKTQNITRTIWLNMVVKNKYLCKNFHWSRKTYLDSKQWKKWRNLQAKKFGSQRRIDNEECPGIAGLYDRFARVTAFIRMMNNEYGCEGITGSSFVGKRDHKWASEH